MADDDAYFESLAKRTPSDLTRSEKAELAKWAAARARGGRGGVTPPCPIDDEAAVLLWGLAHSAEEEGTRVTAAKAYHAVAEAVRASNGGERVATFKGLDAVSSDAEQERRKGLAGWSTAELRVELLRRESRDAGAEIEAE